MRSLFLALALQAASGFRMPRSDRNQASVATSSPTSGQAEYCILQNAVSKRKLYATTRSDYDEGFGAYGGDYFADQVWQILDQDDGKYVIFNALSGRSIFAREGQEMEDGVGASQVRYADHMWYMEDNGDGTWRFRNALSGRRLFAQDGQQMEDGVGAVSGHKYNDGRWEILPCFTPQCKNVYGSWVMELLIASSTNYTTVEGWTKTQTEEYANETTISVGISFSAGGGGFEAGIAHKMSHRTSTSIQKTRSRNISQHFDIDDGGYVWTWRWAVVDQGLGGETSHIMTHYKVQSDVRPRCLPDEQTNREYTKCNPGMCLGRCDGHGDVQVLDWVKHVGTNRVGQITEFNPVHIRPWHVEFHDGAFPPSGWYRADSLELL